MSSSQLIELQAKKYLGIVFELWDHGPEEAHQKYPDLSVAQLTTANQYYDSLRCEGCWCGSCVDIYTLAENLSESPTPCKPLAELAIKLAKQEL